jgi:hypothetical protein
MKPAKINLINIITIVTTIITWVNYLDKTPISLIQTIWTTVMGLYVTIFNHAVMKGVFGGKK